MTKYLVLTALVLGLALPLRAAPLDAKIISANAKWVVHVDVDSLRQSTVMQKVYAKGLSQWKDLPNQMAAIQDQMCMDPAKDLLGITFYGPKPGHSEGVMIVQAAVDQVRFVAKVSKAPGYHKSSHRGHTLNSWTQADGPVCSAFAEKQLVLLAKTEADVKRALDVLDGKAAAVDGKTLLAAAAPAGTIVLIRAVDLAEVDLPFQSPLVKKSESLDLALGESEGQSFSRALLTVASPQVAEQVRSIIEGIRATAQLQFGADPAALHVINSMQVRIASKTVHIETHVPAAEVWSLVGKASDRAAGK